MRLRGTIPALQLIAVAAAALLLDAAIRNPPTAAAQRTPNFAFEGLQGIVLDMDGSVESLTALVTLALHPDASAQLAFVSVTGARWSSLFDAQLMVRRLLTRLGLARVPVLRGAARSISDAYNESTARAQCRDGARVPLSPADAAAADMPFSRFDVDNVFGAADLLGFGASGGSAVELADLPAEEGILQLMARIRSGYARVKYVALSGLTNMALALRRARQQQQQQGGGGGGGGGDLHDVILSRVTVLIYDNGNNIAIDRTAALEVLTTHYLHRLLHAQLFTESVRFSVSKWSRLQAGSDLATPPVQWLVREALGGMRSVVDGAFGDPTAFFRKFSLGGPLVVMCAIDSSTKTAFVPYRGDLREVGDIFLGAAPSQAYLAQRSNDSVLLASNNTGFGITPPAFLVIIPDATHTDGTEIVNASASRRMDGGLASGEPLADVFWRRWLNVLGM